MKILLAIDDSKYSQAAAQAVAAQFASPENEVQVLHVVEPLILTPYFDGGEFYTRQLEGLEKEEYRRGKELVEQTAKSLAERGLRASSSVEEGDPRAAIVDRAAEWKADLVVLGSHGRRGLERLLLGSVSEYVARHARCSVEIVRPPRS
jgi:nucleotide-binding universal stress UspA family protein